MTTRWHSTGRQYDTADHCHSWAECHCDIKQSVTICIFQSGLLGLYTQNNLVGM